MAKLGFKGLKTALSKKFPDLWVRDGADFDGRANKLWTGEGSEINGLPAFEYYSCELDPKEVLYVMGIAKPLYEFLKKNGYYAEFYDGGTVMIYQA